MLVLAVGGGIFLRLHQIGRYGFWTDELFHVFAAKSYLADGSLRVPWESEEYRRAIPVTFLTVLSFKLLGESEAAARLPFALANLAFIGIAYWIVKRLFSRSIAVIFASAIALSIFAIQMSQECRMYTLFQLFYFLMSVAFLFGFEPGLPGGRSGRGEPAPGDRALSGKYLGLAAGCGFLALLVHNLTFNFVFVLAAYWLAMLLYVGFRSGVKSAVGSKYGRALMPIAVVVVIAAVARIPLVEKIIAVALEAPNWNRSVQTNPSFYHQVLTESHPVTWVLYPLGALVALFRFGRKGLFFVLSFLVLFLLHCFVFGRHSERYIFHILPFFLIVGAIGVDFLLAMVGNFLSRPGFSVWHKTVLYAALAVGVTWLIAPRLERSVLDTRVPKFSNWKDLDPALREGIIRGPAVTTERARFNYYFGKYPDYVIDASDPERIGGEKVLLTREELAAVVARHPDLYLVTYNQHMNHEAFVSPEVKAWILSEMERVDHEPDARIMVFRKKAGSGAGG